MIGQKYPLTRSAVGLAVKINIKMETFRGKLRIIYYAAKRTTTGRLFFIVGRSRDGKREVVMKKAFVITFIILSAMVLLLPNNLGLIAGTAREPELKDDTVPDDCVYCILKERKNCREDGVDTIANNVKNAGPQDTAPGKLKPGEYFVKVNGVEDNNRLHKNGKLIEIVVIPQFWTSWWFRLLILAFLGGFFFSLYQLRLKFLALKNSRDTKLNRLFSKYNISKREQEILHLILNGDSKKAIEEKLYISAHTVKNHIYNIYRKLGIKNRVQLVNLVQASKS